MASAATDPTVHQDLSDEEVAKRTKVLTSRIKERRELRQQKADANEGWNATLKLLSEQIDTIGEEVRTRKAWVPAQMQMPGTEDGEPEDQDDGDPDDGEGEPAAAKPAKKRAAKKRGPRIHVVK